MNELRLNRRQNPRTAPRRPAAAFNIGQAAQATGVSAKMIRHYEAIGLIPAPRRTGSNYRVYGENDIHTLQFVKRARGLGFSMKQIETLLDLWRRKRPSSEVRVLASQHASDLDARIREMQTMRDTLRDLARRCRGDERPDCPILEDLSGAGCCGRDH